MCRPKQNCHETAASCKYRGNAPPDHAAVSRFNLLLRVPRSPDLSRIQRLFEFMLVALLTVQVARLMWLMVPATPIGIAPAGTAGAPSQPMPSIDLFYRSEVATAAVASSSAYSLRGVRVGQAGGSAIVADAQGRQHTYAVGDQIASGVALQAVGPGWAMLRSGGRMLRLELPVAAEVPPASTDALPVSTAANGAQATVDPAQLLANAGLSPNDGGGWTVNPRGTPGPLEAAGLRAGDVVQSVNGQTLTPERVATLGDELAAGAAITLTLRRDGEMQTVTLSAKP